MKITTPEISWHAKEAIYSVDIQPRQENEPHRVATAGIDSNVRIWELKPESKTGVAFLSNLSRHERAVNIVRFSKSGKVLASGGDDGTIVLWKLSEKTDAPDIFEDESEVGKNTETWNAIKVLRGHLEDINDLSWSHDGMHMVSGSIDHTAIVWDVSKGSKMCILSEAKHFIHGVAYDPLGQYVAALSCDRSLRIYNIQSRRVIHNVSKMIYPEPDEDTMQIDGEDVPVVKAQRMFHDESVVRRRLEFASDGSMLIVPSGCLNRKEGDQTAQVNTAYIFTRGHLSKPAAVLPGFKQPVTVVRCCPAKFSLRKDAEGSVINLPYRHVFAVASSDTLLLYDTQCLEPFALVGNIHYAAITDVTWSYDGGHVVVSSRDGFCSIVRFEENELGELYVEDSVMVADKAERSPSDGVVGGNVKNSEETAASSPLENVRPASDEKVCSENRESASDNATAQEENSKGSSPIVTETGGEDESSGRNCSCETAETSAPVAPVVHPSSQEKRPRRIQLTTLSASPGTKQPQVAISKQRSALTPSKADDAKKPLVDSSVITPKMTSEIGKDSSAKRKTPRRIQLTPVKD